MHTLHFHVHIVHIQNILCAQCAHPCVQCAKILLLLLLTDGAVFWKKAITVKNAGGDVVLKDLAQFALKVYSLPISNAVVERIFSRVGSVKTKLRSRMGLSLLTSILRIKTSLELQGNCCSSFQPTEQMLSFDSSIYKDAQARADELVAEEEELMEALV